MAHVRFTLVLVLALIGLSVQADPLPAKKKPLGGLWDPGVRGGPLTNRLSSTNITGLDNTGATDVSAALQAIINGLATNKAAVLPAGTFQVSGGLTVPGGVTLRGSKSGSTNVTTIFVPQSSPASYGIRMQANGADLEFSHFSPNNLSGDLLQAATNLTTVGAHNLSVGDYALVTRLPNPTNTVTSYAGTDPPVYDQLPGNTLITWGSAPSGGGLGEGNYRICAQIVHVLTVPDSTHITFEPAMNANYSNTFSPQITKAWNFAQYAGLEDLNIDYRSTSGSTRALWMLGVINSWVYNCNFTNVGGAEAFIQMQEGLWDTIQHCYFHLNGNVTGNSQAYGIYSVQPHTSLLIQDNIVNRAELAFGLEGANSGDAIAYNYVTNIVYIAPDDAQRTMAFAHGGFNHMQLMEGNYSDGQGVDVDNYQGNHGTILFFRNVVLTNPNKTNGNVCVETWGKNWNISVLLNQLGHTNFETRFVMVPAANYTSEMLPGTGNPPTIFRSGYNKSSVVQSFQADYVYPEVSLTNSANFLVHGNFTHATTTNNGVQWDPTTADRSFPLSYLKNPPLYGLGVVTNTNPGIDKTNVNAAAFRFVWGFDPSVSSGDPSITVQPTDQFVNVGSSATFTVTATGLTALSYQWNWYTTNVTGATSATWVTPATLLANDGSHVFVTVTDTGGTATSSTVTLHVSVPAGPANGVTEIIGGNGVSGGRGTF